jgi:hypothetical protein
MIFQRMRQSKFWSTETSIFTKLAVGLLVFYVVDSSIGLVNLVLEYGFFNLLFLNIAVISMALISLFLQLFGRLNVGFLVALAATFTDAVKAMLLSEINKFTMFWDIVTVLGSGANWLGMVSWYSLELVSILLIIGRPELKLTKRKAYPL